MRPSDCGLEEPRGFYPDARSQSQVVDDPARSESDPSRLHHQNVGRPRFDGDDCRLRGIDWLVDRDIGEHLLTKPGMGSEIRCRERLFDIGHVEAVQLQKRITLAPGVGAVGVDADRQLGIPLAEAIDSAHVVAWSNLELGGSSSRCLDAVDWIVVDTDRHRAHQRPGSPAEGLPQRLRAETSGQIGLRTLQGRCCRRRQRRCLTAEARPHPVNGVGGHSRVGGCFPPPRGAVIGDPDEHGPALLDPPRRSLEGSGQLDGQLDEARLHHGQGRSWGRSGRSQEPEMA